MSNKYNYSNLTSNGDFDVLNNGDTYAFIWDIEGNFDAGTYDFSGTYTIDDSIYTFTYSGTE